MSLPSGVKPANDRQKQLVAALESGEVDLVGAFGPSGTGKSFLTCLYGLKAVGEGKYSRFIVVRPLVDVNTGRRYSAVELGDLFFEIASSYLYDLTSGVFGEDEVKKLLEEGKVILADPSFLSGRTFENSLVFLDDAQYVPPEVIYESLLRVGRGSKLVIAGDPVFQAGGAVNGAAIAREVLLGQERTFVVDFGIADIVRPGAKRAFKLALEMKMRRRGLSEDEKRVMDLAYAHAPDAQLITVVDLRPLKEKYGVKNVPDMLIVSKEGFLGRLIGRGGERINKVEEESGLSLRGVELSLDLKQLVCSIHPVGWIRKHVLNVDVVGVNLEVEVNSREFGAFVGQGGAYVRFLDEAFKKMLGVGVKARSVEVEERRRRRR
ncbi:MAG: PhoH family protein [Thermoprotei archaeon]|nr:PhoH family protein [Thermoproteales archaeon]RLE87877.1 MAG: PhoH family protein [Thermoprotei archaeon]